MGGVPQEDYHATEDRHVVLHQVAKRCNSDASRLLGALQVRAPCRCNTSAARSATVAGFKQLVHVLDAAHRSLNFFQRQLQSIEGERSCSICLEEDCELSSLCILPCGHLFHTRCVKEVVEAQGACPECRMVLQSRDISSLQLELKNPAEEPEQQAQSICKEPSPLERAHGTRLVAVAETLL